jgi:hypothetical protein
MAISDTYVVQFLLEGTNKLPLRFAWAETSVGGYAARVGSVSLEIDRIRTTTGERLQLVLRDASDLVAIQEPASVGFLRARYQDEDEERLVVLLKELAAAIVRQVVSRRRRSIKDREQTRERIYRSLLFEEGQGESHGEAPDRARTSA